MPVLHMPSDDTYRGGLIGLDEGWHILACDDSYFSPCGPITELSGIAKFSFPG